MDNLSLPAYAKVNLLLDITGRREDGYHLLRTVMQTIALKDVITFKKLTSGIKVESNNLALPNDKNNLAYRAAELFFKETGLEAGIDIYIEKRIPVAAGLAGGSTDAASVLRALNIIFNAGLTLHKLIYLGKKIGADVPFCIIGGTVFASGIGDELRVLPPLGRMPVVLVNPGFGVSTAEVYKKFNFREVNGENLDSVIEAFLRGDYSSIFKKTRNVLESVTFKMHPELAEIKEEMIARGAVSSLMCGSGPTVFAITDTYSKAQRIAEFFKKKYSEVYTTFTI